MSLVPGEDDCALPDRVERVLRESWSPLGQGVPDDEYQAYVAAVCCILEQKSGDEALLREFLGYVRTVWIGLPPDSGADQESAAALRQLTR